MCLSDNADLSIPVDRPWGGVVANLLGAWVGEATEEISERSLVKMMRPASHLSFVDSFATSFRYVSIEFPMP
jgi:hypothetical protein